MKWLFVIDPLESLKLATDSTYAIMKEAIQQGLDVYHCTIQDLYVEAHDPGCVGKVFSTPNGDQTSPAPKKYDLNAFNLIFMRKDPPYDIGYHYATQILSLARVPVVNSPAALRNYNEKLIILPFPQFIPESIVASQKPLFLNFLADHPIGVVLKSLDSYQGRSVVWIQDASPASVDIVKHYTQDFSIPVMVQEFLPQIAEGDKRILVLGGKILGAVSRIPQAGSILATFGQGGTGKATRISSREEEIVSGISRFLLANGLHFVGIDVIGRFLTEINITCPTGIIQINALNGMHLEEKIVAYFRNLCFNGNFNLKQGRSEKDFVGQSGSKLIRKS